MQRFENYSIPYPQAPMSALPAAHPSMMSPFYMPRPLPTGFPHQFPPPIHPFTLAERLAGIGLSRINSDIR